MWLISAGSLLLLFLAGTQVTAGPFHQGDNNVKEACWERCFQVDGSMNEQYKDVYDRFYRAGMEARRLKNLYNTNGTAFLVDNTLSEYHEPTETPGLEREDMASNIFLLQQRLVQMMAFMTGNDDVFNPFFFVGFNEEYAWGCTEQQCLDCCEAYQFMDHLFYARETSSTSHCPGAIEPACRLAKNYMTDSECQEQIQNEMAIAITNSDFRHSVRPEHDEYHHRERHYDHQHKKGYGYGYGDQIYGNGLHEYHDHSECTPYYDDYTYDNSYGQDYDAGYGYVNKFEYSPCRAHFDTRLVIGIHSTENEDMHGWESKSAKSIYIHDSRFTQKAADEISYCMYRRCCFDETTDTVTTEYVSNCHKTEGKLGETIVDDPNNPILIAQE